MSQQFYLSIFNLPVELISAPSYNIVELLSRRTTRRCRGIYHHDYLTYLMKKFHESSKQMNQGEISFVAYYILY